MELTLVVAWLIFAAVVSIIASSRGRFWLGWLLLSIVISPVLALILVLALPGRAPAGPPPGTKICPRCAETVKAEAKICRFCGHEFAAPDPAPAPRGDSRPLSDAAGFLILAIVVLFAVGAFLISRPR